jgi:hypothetical protein
MLQKIDCNISPFKYFSNDQFKECNLDRTYLYDGRKDQNIENLVKNAGRKLSTRKS